MPNEASRLLDSACRALQLTAFETIEVMGSTWATEKLWEQTGASQMSWEKLDQLSEHDFGVIDMLSVEVEHD